MKRTTYSIVTVFCLLILATAGLCSNAAASEGVPVEGDQAKNFGGSLPLTIPAAAFSTKGNDAQSHNFVWWAGFVKGTALPGGCVQAPVYLPRWARVYQVWASVIDNDAGNNMSVWLTRSSNLTPGDANDMATISTSGSSSSVQSLSDSSINDPIVILPDYAYHVSTCLASGDLKLISVRIWYHEDVVFVDGFERGDASAWSEVSP
ncbi:MAG: hypothetical protein ABFS37_04285 [Acidobacteriota bacterium]